MTVHAHRLVPIMGARVLPMTGSGIVDDATVLVQAGRNVVAASRTSTGIPGDAEIVDATGYSVLPGPIDVQVHSESATATLLYVKNGVTTGGFAGGFWKDSRRSVIGSGRAS